MRLCVPYTVVQPATAICLIPYRHALFFEVDDYRRYWAERWAEGQTFINLEHDVVFWPGALENLWPCREPWCAFGYHKNDQFGGITPFPYLGLVKLSAELIAATGGWWTADDDWQTCDRDLAAGARAAGFEPHQHYPGVVNANPVLLKEH